MTLSRFLKREKPVLTTNYTLDFSCWVELRADAFVHVVFAEYLKMLSRPGLQSYAVQLVKGKAFLFLLLSFLAARGQCKYSLFFLAFCFFEGIEGDIWRSMFVGYCRRTTQGGGLREPCASLATPTVKSNVNKPFLTKKRMLWLNINVQIDIEWHFSEK